MVALLVVIIATVEIRFGRKKLLDTKAPLRDNGFKNPARYIDELLKTLPPNRSFPFRQFFSSFKNVSRIAYIKTKSATIAFFYSSPVSLLPLPLFRKSLNKNDRDHVL